MDRRYNWHRLCYERSGAPVCFSWCRGCPFADLARSAFDRRDQYQCLVGAGNFFAFRADIFPAELSRRSEALDVVANRGASLFRRVSGDGSGAGDESAQVAFSRCGAIFYESCSLRFRETWNAAVKKFSYAKPGANSKFGRTSCSQCKGTGTLREAGGGTSIAQARSAAQRQGRKSRLRHRSFGIQRVACQSDRRENGAPGPAPTTTTLKRARLTTLRGATKIDG